VCASMTGWRDGYVEGVCFNDRMEGWQCGRCVLQWQYGGMAMWKVVCFNDMMKGWLCRRCASMACWRDGYV